MNELVFDVKLFQMLSGNPNRLYLLVKNQERIMFSYFLLNAYHIC